MASLLMLVCGAGCDSGWRSSQPFDLSSATYLGMQSCVPCHQAEAKKHSGSNHDRAMQLATESSVLGDFSDATLEHHGILSRFFRDGAKFMVHTEGPDGKMQDFEVKYVFGVEPLQQYMVEFPTQAARANPTEGSPISSTAISSTATFSIATGTGLPGKSSVPSMDADSSVAKVYPRIQVLRLSWDTEQGKWFHLNPPDVSEKLDPHDDLHWTGVAQRWNTMCADCHSTDYKKNFQIVSESVARQQPPVDGVGGSFHSTFVEINVSCESCHGPGSVHVELAKKWSPGWNRERGYGLANLKASAENQIQACAPCHSRRSPVAAGFKAGDNFYDFYTNQLLTESVYYPDGQVLDEDYVHGSFIQSKMYHKGIRCSDCHDPHTARLKHDGNAVCTSCHQHPAAKYDSVAHHFHPPADGTSPERDGTSCVNCHMPTTTYMAVDARRDHSLRVPRPDISLATGSPNACTGCHLNHQNVAPEKAASLVLYQDWMQAARDGDTEVAAELERVNRWCDEACERWYGETRRKDEHFGFAISAGQTGQPDATEKLVELLRKRGFEAPAIARATALEVLMSVDPVAAGTEAVRSIDDEHPLVRSAATRALIGHADQAESVRLLETALSDPVRSVRTEAARNLLNFPGQMRNPVSSSVFRRVFDELVAGIETSNDRAGAHLTLGILAEQLGNMSQALDAYSNAIRVEPRVAGPRTNLAALMERGQSARLETEIARLRKEELGLLQRDLALLPESGDLQYRVGLALYLDGQLEAAVQHLTTAAELESQQVAYAQAVAMLHETLKQWPDAIKWAEEAIARSDGAEDSKLLLDRIRKSAKQ